MTDPVPGIGALGRPRPVLHHEPFATFAPASVDTLGQFAPGCSLFRDGHNGMARLTLAPGQVRVDTEGFDGAYVSLALDLPAAMAQDLDPSHDLRLGLTLSHETAPPGAGYVRLNVDDGGPIWQQTVPLVILHGAHEIALGPGHTLPPRPSHHARKAWIDLVLTELGDSGLTVSDLRITRGHMLVL